MLKVIEPSENRVVRFAIGSESNPTSSVWRLWTSGDDAYLNFAPIPYPKFSMHGQVWKIDFNTKRHSFGPITCPNAKGWIQGPAVFFCHVPYDPMPPPPGLLREVREEKNIRWFDMPEEWHVRQFVVFFASREVGKAELPPRDTAADPVQHAIGPLPLGDGRWVWLRQATQPVPEDRKNYLLTVRASVEGLSVDASARELRSLGLAMHLQGSTVVVVPLGLETIHTK